MSPIHLFDGVFNLSSHRHHELLKLVRSELLGLPSFDSLNATLTGGRPGRVRISVKFIVMSTLLEGKFAAVADVADVLARKLDQIELLRRDSPWRW